MNITQSLLDRFWSKVNKSDGCWEWTAGRGRRGYGKFKVNRRTIPSHRISWIIHNGPIPPGMMVCHKCDNPPCVNPEHLFVSDHYGNMADKVSKRRQVMGEDQVIARLTSDQVSEILGHEKFLGSQKILARKFGVHKTTISKIITRVNWKQIEK